MNETITREFENYRKAEAEARSVLDTHAGEDDLSPEEQEHFDRAIEHGQKAQDRYQKLVAMDEQRVALETTIARVQGTPAADATGDRSAIERFSAVSSSNAALMEAIQLTKSEYRAGRADYGKEVAHIVGKIDLEKRAALGDGFEQRTITDFGMNTSLYVTDFATKVAVYQRTVSPWINLAEVINADNGRPLTLPNLSVDPTSYSPGEGTAITAADPTLGSAALTTTAYKALEYVSMEAEEDELVGLMGYLAKAQGRSIGLKFGSDLTVAIVAAATNGGTASGVGGVGTATVTFIGLEDLLDLKFGLAVPYRQAGSWIMANGLIKKIRKFHDGNGNYFYQSASNPQTAASFDGDPIYEDPYLAAPASVTKSVLYGDASAVVIKQMPLRVATSPDFKFDLDVVALKTVYRAGGALPDVAAIRYMISANT